MKNMPAQKRINNENVIALLNRYPCPIPFHAVRTRFLGGIVSPVPDRSPVHIVQELWGGELPPMDNVEDLNYLLRVLMESLWNPLTAHQIVSNPFQLTPLQIEPTRESVHSYAVVRKQEIEGFMDGLFGPREDVELPENAHKGVEALGEMRAILMGAIALLADARSPAAGDDLQGLAVNLRALAMILEREINSVVLSCTRAGRQVLAEQRQIKATMH